jgi:hypothetical protein
MQLHYAAASLAETFEKVYQLALEAMHNLGVDKLLLDLKRNAPPTDEDEEFLLAPIMRHLPAHAARPLFIAALLSEGQYQHQMGCYSPSFDRAFAPQQVEFNYFTSRREATDWLSDN